MSKNYLALIISYNDFSVGLCFDIMKKSVSILSYNENAAKSHYLI